MPVIEWTGKKLKESNGTLTPTQHGQKQKKISQWNDLLLKTDKNPDLAVFNTRLFVRLSALNVNNKQKVQNDTRTIYEDGDKFWGELV